MHVVGEEAHLRRPRRVVDLDEQRAVLEPHRPDVGRDAAPTASLPAAEHAADLGAGRRRRASDRSNPSRRVGHRHRVVVASPASRPPTAAAGTIVVDDRAGRRDARAPRSGARRGGQPPAPS